MAGLPWSREDEQRLCRDYPAGVPLDTLAAALGRTEDAIRNKAQFMGLKWGATPKGFSVQAPPKASRDFAAIFEGQVEAYRNKSARHIAKKQGITVTIHEDAPYGILLFGDPHVDDDGCDIEYLSHCLSVVRETEGLYAVNIGDLTNNWIGRLGALYAHQHTTDDEAAKLAEWLIGSIPWLWVILGNHDKWSVLAERICEEHGVTHVSHGGVFVIRCGEHEMKVDARHDHAGRSMYNPAHGQIKRNYRGSDARVIVGGHIHQGARTTIRNGVTGQISECIRLGAFKKHDEYADMKGFDEDSIGPACLVTVDPRTDSVQVFWEVDEGARYLTWLRERAA